MPKNKQSKLIASVKTPNIGFINKYIINSGIRGVGGAIQCYLITNHFSQILKYLSISPPLPDHFSL